MNAKPSSFFSALFDEESQKILRFPLALLVGIFASVTGSLGWLAVSTVSSFQIGYMAVAVGILVGWSMRFVAGEGSRKLAFSSATLSFFGCIGGNLLSACYYVAKAHELPFLDLFVTLDPGYSWYLLTQTFDIMDLIFYGIGIVQGYQMCVKK
ncbi:MAG: hypothetical protein ACI9S8_003013 [Chlamydiales bacterium]|jgi:hypothetical protein